MPGDPLVGIGHVGYEVTSDVVHRLADGIDPAVLATADAAAGSVPGVIHAHARARWTGRTLRIEIEGWVDPDLTARGADNLGRLVAQPDYRSDHAGTRRYRLTTAYVRESEGRRHGHRSVARHNKKHGAWRGIPARGG